MEEEKKERYAAQFVSFDYDRLISNPPTDSKGKVNKAKYSEQRENAKKIKDAFILTTSMKEKMVEERQKHCELQKTYVEFAKRRRSGLHNGFPNWGNFHKIKN